MHSMYAFIVLSLELSSVFTKFMFSDKAKNSESEVKSPHMALLEL